MKKIFIKLISILLLLWTPLIFVLPVSADSVLQAPENASSSMVSTSSVTPLDWAKQLIDDIDFTKNIYGSNPTYIEWKGVDGATESKNRTVCSSFITRLLKRAYGYSSADIKKWMGTTNPKAATYFNAITEQKHFQSIAHINEIKPGDLFTIKYLENAQNGTDESEPNVDENPSDVTQCPRRSRATGHIVLIRQAAVVHPSSPPLQPNLTQYSLKVIDSSRSGHGCKDTRLLPNKSCSDSDAWGNGGVGQGTMRLYADSDGTIAGYTWSLRSKSTFYSPDGYENSQGCQIPGHPLAVGRLLK
jgi:hypothetical protein